MRPFLADLLPIDLLMDHLKNGVVRCQEHPEFPELFVLNYSEKAQFERTWDAVTNVCRGLIVKVSHNFEDATVVARPFGKFHNLNTDGIPETQEANLPDETPLITTKLDGSMGTLFTYEGKWHVATRGSFSSDQAKWATAHVRNVLKIHLLMSLPKFTPVVEIVYPANRIVVDYDWEGISLLGIVHNHSGHEVPRVGVEEWGARVGIPVVPLHEKTLEQCVAENRPNEEGYVLTYPNAGLKVKVKFADYVRLHRVVTGMNPKTVWEMLTENRSSVVEALLADEKMPRAFRTWLRGWRDQLTTGYNTIWDRAQQIFWVRPFNGTFVSPPSEGVLHMVRKKQALYFNQPENAPYAQVCFALLDGKDPAPIIWKMLKPKASDVYRKEG